MPWDGVTPAKQNGLSELRRMSCESGKTIMAEIHRTQSGRGEVHRETSDGERRALEYSECTYMRKLSMAEKEAPEE